MLIHLPGIGRSTDSIIAEACKLLGIERWGGPSDDGWSKHSDFLRCPYRYYLKHVSGMGPLVVGDQAPALDIGACTHLLLAAHYARQLPDDRYPGWQQNCPRPEELLDALKTCGLPLMIAVEVERLFEGYAEYYQNDVLEPVAVEMMVGEKGVHTSRYDLVFYIEDGIHDGLWIGEHKTMSPSADLEDFRLDGEVTGEMFSWVLGGLQDFFGMQVNGVCINALVKGKTVPRYQRLWIPINYHIVTEYGNDRGHWNQWLGVCQERNIWPRSYYGCKSNFRRCRFWEHCRTRDDGQLVKLEQQP